MQDGSSRLTGFKIEDEERITGDRIRRTSRKLYGVDGRNRTGMRKKITTIITKKMVRNSVKNKKALMRKCMSGN